MAMILIGYIAFLFAVFCLVVLRCRSERRRIDREIRIMLGQEPRYFYYRKETE